MQIRFETNDFGDEAASLRAADEGGAPDEADHLWGQIVLEHSGQPAVAIKDDLTILGLALCADVPEAIERDGRADLHLVGWPGEFTFESRGNSVHIVGSTGDSADFPRDELLASLRACGQRLATFMDALSLGCPQFAFSSRALGAALANPT